MIESPAANARLSVMKSPSADRWVGTCCGIAALMFWSASVAVTRSTTEKLSPFTVGACVYTAAGLLSCLRVALSREQRAKISALPVAETAVCIATFMGYLACFYLAIGLARTREQTLEAGLMNHTWPTQTVLLSLVLVGARARWTLIPGLLLALAGSVGQSAARGLSEFTITLPCVLACIAALNWALYSNLTRRWAAVVVVSPLPVAMLLCGILLGSARLVLGGGDHWSTRTVLEIVYSAICPTFLGYALWDRAMRSSAMILVVALSFLSPIFSTLIAALYWGESIDSRIWYGCVAIVAGAILCRWSLVEPEKSADAEVDLIKGKTAAVAVEA